jgi:hypothetical protein
MKIKGNKMIMVHICLVCIILFMISCISPPPPSQAPQPTPTSPMMRDYWYKRLFDVAIICESFNELNFSRGNSTIINLTISGVGINVTKGTEIILSYSIEAWYPDGTHYPSNNISKPAINVSFEPRSVTFPRSSANRSDVIKLNATAIVEISALASDGNYYLWIGGKSNQDIEIAGPSIPIIIGKGGKPPI